MVPSYWRGALVKIPPVRLVMNLKHAINLWQPITRVNVGYPRAQSTDARSSATARSWQAFSAS
jgi:hypothetical protein